MYNDNRLTQFTRTESHSLPSTSEEVCNVYTRKRAICLYRVSTLRQVDEKDDIPMQKSECQKFAARMDWEVVDEKYEKGISGYKISANDRDELQSIKQAAISGKFDILLVYMFDRLGRKEDETPFVVQWFVDQGIEVWSVMEGQQKFDSHVDKLMNYIRYWQASGESEKTSLRTRSGLAQTVMEGHFKGGTRPYGYNLVKKGRLNKRGHEVYDLEINPYEAGVVNYMFDLYANEGMGTHRMASHLTAKGIASQSGSWHPATILNMLKNPLYTGVLRSGNTKSEPFDEFQIISDELFQKAQALINTRKRSPDRSAPMGTKSLTLCSGNIFCGHCGSRLTATTSGKAYVKKDGTKVPKRIAYVCYGATRKRVECNGARSYTAKIIDEIVENAVRAIFTKLNHSPVDEIMDMLLLKKQFDTAGQLQKTSEQLKDAQKVVDALQEELVKSVMGVSKLSQDDIDTMLQKNKQIVSTLQQQVEVMQSQSNKNYKELDRLGMKLEQTISWSEIFNSTEIPARKMIIANLVDRVTVKHIGGKYNVEIVLNKDLKELLLGDDRPAGIPEAITEVA